jgi:hypothetical protein
MVLLFLMIQAFAPEHDDQKNYPLFNRLGTDAAQRRNRRASVRLMYIIVIITKGVDKDYLWGGC